MRRHKDGLQFGFADGLSAKCLGRTETDNRVLLEIRSNDSSKSVGARLSELGLMPIPPYIRGGMADDLDRETYQTVMANEPGSVACPTAGLHFSERLLHEISDKGVKIATITLHVGTASFAPIRDADIAEHQMTEERYCLSERTCREICSAKQEGRRVVVVGTTCVRALESGARTAEYALLTGDDSEADSFDARDQSFIGTDLFITPGFGFRVVDCLITNFHQPCSTHLLLVGAFAGCQNIKTIYHHALAGDYRFLSYGDSMLLEPQVLRDSEGS
jgi:S-adenosylmethionine:tRNA ribosyltransferase-isomerase